MRKFWELPGRQNAQGPLEGWYAIACAGDWQSMGELKRTFPSANIVGDCVVFNIGGNKFRLITRIRFAMRRVYVLRVMTHHEYDGTDWKDECGCFKPPPR